MTRSYKFIKTELQFPPENPPDSGILANNSHISSRKTGHVDPIPFLILGIPVVTIVASLIKIRYITMQGQILK